MYRMTYCDTLLHTLLQSGELISYFLVLSGCKIRNLYTKKSFLGQLFSYD
jgi:hypothetical protein